MINECNKIYKQNIKRYKNIDKEILETEDNLIQTSNSKIDFNILIECLNYEEKLIITLFYNNKYTCNEISKILNMNVNTVKSKITRAKDKIKERYKGGLFYE